MHHLLQLLLLRRWAASLIVKHAEVNSTIQAVTQLVSILLSIHSLAGFLYRSIDLAERVEDLDANGVEGVRAVRP